MTDAVPAFVAAPREPLAGAGLTCVERRACARPAARTDDRRPGRPGGDALHLGHDRPSQGLHAHAPQRDDNAVGRPVELGRHARDGGASASCRCST